MLRDVAHVKRAAIVQTGLFATSRDAFLRVSSKWRLVAALEKRKLVNYAPMTANVRVDIAKVAAALPATLPRVDENVENVGRMKIVSKVCPVSRGPVYLMGIAM